MEYQDEHIKRLFARLSELERIVDERSKPVVPPPPRTGLCGAKTRKGTPCQCKAIEGKNRCKLHGGKSTGAKTAEGIERIRQGQARRWAKASFQREAHENNS
ncbi:HGGxSTG domain-containing protein [Agrobacterium sp. ST15.13.015]|uniref:HGGxSTG domain-containing protein n=1 Tax=Agrobacterium sp. ST15.13.015 TaxID=3017319 RepID=UPI003FA46370